MIERIEFNMKRTWTPHPEGLVMQMDFELVIVYLSHVSIVFMVIGLM